MKKVIFCFLFSFLFLSIKVNALSSASTGVYQLKIRTLPDTSSLEKGLIPAATTITLLENTLESGKGCDDNWFKIKYNDIEGYSCSTYLTAITWETEIPSEDTDKEQTDNSENEQETPSTDIVVDMEKIYQEELKKFPESYKEKIELLHKKYPNAIFKAQMVDVSFNKYATYQYQGYSYGSLNGCFVSKEKGGSLLEDTTSSRDGLKSLEPWAYTALTDTFNTSYYGGEAGRWYAPSLSTVKYYVDPRNFLTETGIFMFEELSYAGDYYLESDVEKVLKGTFMYKTNVTVPTGKEPVSFAQTFIDAGKKNGISPYFLVSRVIQEIGHKRSSMTSGTWTNHGNAYYGYYNFYNVNAAGNSVDETIKNGLEYAKSVGWNNEYDAIVGGASFITDGYINAGQGTPYFQKFDVYGPCYGFHQYMQNIEAPLSEAYKTYKAYNEIELFDSNFVFIIPVYEDMPNETKLDDSRNSNNYLRDLTVNGTTIEEFDYLKEEYTINVSSMINSIEIAATKSSSKSKVTGTGPFEILEKEQTKEIVVTAENGTTRTYKIIVTKDESVPISVSEILNTMLIDSDGTYISSIDLNTKASSFITKVNEVDKNAKVVITNSKDEQKQDEILVTGDKVTITSGEEVKNFTVVIYGDVDGNGTIDKLDALAILRHHYEYITHTDVYKVAADTDKNGNIDKLDALAVLRDYYDYEKIEQ